MSTYPTYKPSGIEWLGDIPEHWEVKRLKLIGENIGGLTYSPDDVLEDESGTLVLRSSNIQNGKFSEEDNVFVDLEISNKQTTYVDDILLCVRNGSVALVGKNILIDEETSGLSFGAFMSVFRSKSNSYIYWFFNSPIFSAQKGLFSTTTINQLTSGILYAMYSALPPIEEQTAIANYLDEKTTKLDQLISNKKAQIDKLKEIRQIEINTAVTKGLDPNVTLKPSGIEWLGDIPEHWEVKRLKNVSTNVQTGTTPKTAILRYYEDEDIKWFTPVDFTKNIRLTNSKSKISQIAIDEGAGRLFPSGSVLLLGIGATIGKVGLITEDSSSNQQINCITFNAKMDSLFAAFALKIYETEIIKIANFSTMPIFNQSNSANINIGIPPIAEQTAIANYLDEKTSKLDQLVSNLESQIEQLEEVRKIEIYNAVTGKIKVA